MIRKLNGFAVVLGLAAVLGLLAPSAAQAVILVPGAGPVAPTGIAVAPTGAVLAVSGPTPFSTPLGDSGTLLTAVVEDTPGGTLDFLYQWTSDAANTENFTRTTASTFGGFTTDVDYLTAAVVLGANLTAAGFTAPSGAPIPVPTTVQRSIGPGNSVNWGFDGLTFLPDSTTTILIVKTNARFYTTGVSGILDGGTANVPSYSPAIPEPASILTWLGFGLAALFIFRKRRK